MDLSLSTNPYGPPPYLANALARGRREVAAYPDRSQAELTRRLAENLRLDPHEVLVGGSASELLRAAIAAFGTRRRVIVPEFTYGEYRRVAASVGATLEPVPMPRLRLDPSAFAARARSGSLFVLPNPGTPNGQYLAPRELSPVVEAAERSGSLLLVDESYLPFVSEGSSVAGSSPNVLTVFSWSKVLGTPGLPLGHAVAPDSVLRGLRVHTLPWNVGPFARHLGLLALERPAWTRKTLERVHRTAEVVRRRLGSASRTHFFTVRARSASALAGRLAARGFRVRDLSSMGLEHRVRFAVRRPPETLQFLAALDELR